MRITRYTHSCVRLEMGDHALVLDPGVWSEPEALVSTDLVLVTHEHNDHLDPARLLGLDAAVYVPAGSDLHVPGQIMVEVGSAFEAAGFEIEVVGGQHGRVVDSRDPCVNVGYIVNGHIYHPGDALHMPDRAIDTLFVPLHASWLKTCEIIDFVQQIGPRRAYGIHDGQLSPAGVHAVNRWLSEECGSVYEWLAPGTTVVLDMA